MKKYLMALSLVIIAFGFTGCKDDSFKSANVNWVNDPTSPAAVKNITWETVSGVPNQIWTTTVPKNGISETKSVTLETGKGRCLDASGAPEYEILINNTSITYVLTDGATETLHIGNLVAK